MFWRVKIGYNRAGATLQNHQQLAQFGLRPDALIGHSAGEVAAHHLAGLLTFEQAVQVIYHRSRLQQRTTGLGRMLAVGLDADTLLRTLDAEVLARRAAPFLVLSPAAVFMAVSADAIFTAVTAAGSSAFGSAIWPTIRTPGGVWAASGAGARPGGAAAGAAERPAGGRAPPEPMEPGPGLPAA